MIGDEFSGVLGKRMELEGHREGAEAGRQALCYPRRSEGTRGRVEGRSKTSMVGGEQEGMCVAQGTGELGTWLARGKRPVWGDKRNEFWTLAE